jgi:pantoate--beta-alanine ligase
MQIITEPDRMQSISETLRLQHQRIGVVMTMGALHEGHLNLVKLAQQRTGTVILTIFVNPTQFGPDEDFHRYPRPFEKDAALAKASGVDYLFAPTPELMYPVNCRTSIDPGPIAGEFEGRSRPGHFSGVATVVVKLLNITRPHIAVFGEKDAQQLAVIRRVAGDLNIGTEIVEAPIAREEDGLAISSRNIYLSSEERQRATVLFRGIRHAEQQTGMGRRDLDVIAREVEQLILSVTGSRADYVSFVGADTLEAAETAVPGNVYRLLLAAYIGTTRLIDNWKYVCA